MSKLEEALNETVNKFADVILLGGHEERNATNLTNAIDYLERTPQIRTLRKCVKALEIIKKNPYNSGICIEYLKINKHNLNMLDYKHYCMTIKDALQEGEYDLLKEVLE